VKLPASELTSAFQSLGVPEPLPVTNFYREAPQPYLYKLVKFPHSCWADLLITQRTLQVAAHRVLVLPELKSVPS